MQRLFVLLFMLLPTLVFADASCPPFQKPVVYANTSQSLGQIAAHECQKIATSPQCKNIYAQIEKDKEDLNKYKRTCSNEELKTDAENFLLSGSKILACGAGLYDSIIGEFGRSIGEGAAKIVTDFQIDGYCDKHLDYKKMLYLSHNAEVPPDLKIKMPSDKVLNAYSCSDLKRSIYEEGRHALALKQYESGATFESTSASGLLKLSKAKLDELGIRIECYNPQKSVELICKIAGYASQSVIPELISLKLKMAAGTFETNEAIEAAESSSAASALQPSIETVQQNAALLPAERATELQKTFPQLNNDQIKAVLRAHDEVPCKVYECSPSELSKKAKILSDAMIDKDTRRELIESGFAGNSSTASSSLADQLSQLGFKKSKPVDVAKPTEKLASSPSPCVGCSIDMPPLCDGCPALKYTPNSDVHSAVHMGMINPDQISKYKNLSSTEKAEVIRQVNLLPRDKVTTFFPPGTKVQDVVKKLAPENGWGKVGTDTGNPVHAISGPMYVDGKEYMVRVAYCAEIHCGSFKKGEIVSIYPTCGPDVISITSATRLKYLDPNEAPAFLVPCH